MRARGAAVSLLLITAIAFWAVWRMASFNPTTVYIVLPDARVAAFPAALADISNANGLNAYFGNIGDEEDQKLHVIEGSSFLLRLWGQNVPLSGEEDAVKCGHDAKPRPDPRQFIVTVEARLPFLGSHAKDAAARIRKDLTDAGYPVRSEPAECG